MINIPISELEELFSGQPNKLLKYYFTTQIDSSSNAIRTRFYIKVGVNVVNQLQHFQTPRILISHDDPYEVRHLRGNKWIFSIIYKVDASLSTRNSDSAISSDIDGNYTIFTMQEWWKKGY